MKVYVDTWIYVTEKFVNMGFIEVYTFFSSRVIFGLREKNSLKQYTRFTLILYVFPCIIALMEFGERMYGDGIYVLS